MTRTQTKLLLVDDHKVVNLGLRALFDTVPHFVVVGEAGSVVDAITEVGRSQPDVVVMDVRLPDGSGVETCREIRARWPNVRVLMLTSYADEDAVIASIVAGAAGYLLKQAEPERLIEAIEIVADGGMLLDSSVTESVRSWMQRLGTSVQDASLVALSDQERKILPLIADGKTNREIAEILTLSEHTVKTHVSSILRKLQLSRRVEAAAFLARHRRQAET